MARVVPMSEEEIEQIKELSARSLPVPEIARRVGRPVRTVCRVRARLNLAGSATAPYSEADRRRIEQLRAEGMISPWISEDIGRTPGFIARRYPMPPGAKLEWSRAWQAIRRSPRMLELHREFSPKFHAHD